MSELSSSHTPASSLGVMTRSAYHAGQFVVVRVSATKTEIGQIEALDDHRATIATASGFSVSRGISALEPAWLVVLDLNGVLGFRKTSKHFQMRPHVQELLTYLFRHFVVGVWTSCAEHNGVRIIKDVFGDLEGRLAFKMFRDECTPNPTPENPYGTFKDLRRLWDRFPYFSAANTIMVDDSEDKCSHRHNALCPTPYTGEESVGTRADEGLREIVAVLDEVLAAKSFEPVRRHMLARWEADASRSGAASCNNTGASPPPPPFSSPPTGAPVNVSTPSVPEPAVFPSSASAALVGVAKPLPNTSPFAIGAKASPEKEHAARHAAKQRARQDAIDSDEEGRPSLGNTPLAGLAATGIGGPALSDAASPMASLTVPVPGATHTSLLYGSLPVRNGPSRANASQQQRKTGSSDAARATPPPQSSANSTPGSIATPGSSVTGGGSGLTSIQERMRAIALAKAVERTSQQQFGAGARR